MRERTGELRLRERDGMYMGRVRSDNGARTEWRELWTKDPYAASERLARWVETGEAPSSAPKETFTSAAVRHIRKMDARPGQRRNGVKNRQQRLADYVVPLIGAMPVGEITTADVARVLDAMARRNKARGTIHHCLCDMSRVFAMLRREGAIRENPASRVGIPDEAVEDDRLPIILTEDELLRFRRRGFDKELDMMVLFVTDLAGHRTSDLHAACWDDCDTKHFRTITVRRPKTTDKRGRELRERRSIERHQAGGRRATRAYERVLHKITPTVREPLMAWWRKQGCPVTGPIFPVRKGPRAGQFKGDNISYAKAFRDALWEEGIVRPLPGFDTAVGEERRKFCALQVDTETTRAVDFHSLRRFFATALANAGVSEQDAMDLTGHSVASTHARYRGPRLVEVPNHALVGHGQDDPAPVAAHEGAGGGGAHHAPPAQHQGIDPTALAAAVAGAVAQAMAALTHPQHLPPPVLQTPAIPAPGSKTTSN